MTPLAEQTRLEFICLMARIRINNRIEDRAAEIIAETLDAFNDLRRRQLLPRLEFLHGSRTITAPASLTCPECGGRIVIEIDDYEIVSRRPESESLHVVCENDDTDEGIDAHRYWFSDWHPIRARAARWARRYVRVMS
ncbi:MAG: hypothetical protein Q8M53_10775 [Burkholderiales bacterium]|nr:hypothetical protein [Burkholderiales bacterium]